MQKYKIFLSKEQKPTKIFLSKEQKPAKIALFKEQKGIAGWSEQHPQRVDESERCVGVGGGGNRDSG